MTLPSFSTEEEDEEDDDNNNDNGGDNDSDGDADDDDEEEVDFPNQGNVQRRRQTVQTGKQPRKLIAVKNLNLIQAPRHGKSGLLRLRPGTGQHARERGMRQKEAGWLKLNSNGM